MAILDEKSLTIQTVDVRNMNMFGDFNMEILSILWYVSAAGHTTKSASPSSSFVVSNGSDGGRVSKQVLKACAQV